MFLVLSYQGVLMSSKPQVSDTMHLAGFRKVPPHSALGQVSFHLTHKYEPL
jgi:hypothetical protein